MGKITSNGSKRRFLHASNPMTYHSRVLATLGGARGGEQGLEKKGKGLGAKEGLKQRIKKW